MKHDTQHKFEKRKEPVCFDVARATFASEKTTRFLADEAKFDEAATLKAADVQGDLKAFIGGVSQASLFADAEVK
jgi:hypothetical protein